MRRSVVGMVLAVMLTAGQAAAQSQSYAEQAGWGMAAVGANLLYMPAKVIYAGIGTVTGGLAYVLTLGNTRAVEVIWSPALGGTYVLSPAMIRGEEPILFFGESVE